MAKIIRFPVQLKPAGRTQKRSVSDAMTSAVDRLTRINAVRQSTIESTLEVYLTYTLLKNIADKYHERKRHPEGPEPLFDQGNLVVANIREPGFAVLAWEYDGKHFALDAFTSHGYVYRSVITLAEFRQKYQTSGESLNNLKKLSFTLLDYDHPEIVISMCNELLSHMQPAVRETLRTFSPEKTLNAWIVPMAKRA